QQPAEESLAAYASDIQCASLACCRRAGRGLVERAVSDRGVGPVGVVEPDILLRDMVEMPKAEAQEVIQALALERSDPGLDKAVRIRGQEGGAYAPNPGAEQHALPRKRELLVPVVDDEPRFQLVVAEPHQQVPALLLNPLLVGVIGRRAEK